MYSSCGTKGEKMGYCILVFCFSGCPVSSSKVLHHFFFSSGILELKFGSQEATQWCAVSEVNWAMCYFDDSSWGVILRFRALLITQNQIISHQKNLSEQQFHFYHWPFIQDALERVKESCLKMARELQAWMTGAPWEVTPEMKSRNLEATGLKHPKVPEIWKFEQNVYHL